MPDAQDLDLIAVGSPPVEDHIRAMREGSDIRMDVQTPATHKLNRRQQQAMLSNFRNEPQRGLPIVRCNSERNPPEVPLRRSGINNVGHLDSVVASIRARRRA